MKKNFTVILPDEPYKTSIALNKTVQCTYEGVRYLIARLEDSTNIVQNIVKGNDSLDQLDIESHKEEGYSFFIIDAAQNPLEAAFLSHTYTHGDIDPYEETLPTGEVWKHVYESGNGILEHIYIPFTLKYNLASKTFSGPDRRIHFITRESFFDGMKDFPARIREALEINDYTDEERAKLENHLIWLENLETTYADVDHWKIPYPTDIPQF